MDVHEEVFCFDFADTHPLGLPGLIVHVPALGETIALPFAFNERREEDGTFVPSSSEDNVAHVFAAHAFHVWFGAQDLPFSAVELGEARILFAKVVIAVVGNDDAALAGVTALEVRTAWEGESFCQVFDERGLESVDVEFEEFSFHAEHVNTIGGVFEVGESSGEPDVFQIFDKAPLASHVDGVGADDCLVTLLVNEAVGVGAIVDVDQFCFQVFVNAIKAKA